MALAAAPLLYVHPCGHLNDLVVPAGALSCMNAVALPKLGRYGFEVSDDELRAATILATDFHWSVGLAGTERLLRHAKQINPALRTVVGGISAGHYGRALFELPELDFVVRGDSELAFAALVTELVCGDEPQPIANVFSRRADPPLSRRMTSSELDQTNVLDADWFPTYARVSQWDAAAFGMGRTIPVARGCTKRCPACYGSYASTFGPGVLLRSPAGLARELRRAEAMDLRNLRLVLGKPPPATLTAWAEGLAAAGPFRFATTVGLYLCTPPSLQDLAALEAAFAAPLALSFVPPVEHAPALDAASVAREMAAWRDVAAHATRSARTSLDVWLTGASEPQAVLRELGVARRGRVTVSLGAGWHVTRPTDGAESASLAAVRALSEAVWTFYAARLLSPALARLLEPFALLDEMARRPETEPRPPDELGAYFDVVMQSWRDHRLPVIPDLPLFAVAVRLAHQPVLGRGRGWGAATRGQRAVRRMVVQRTAQGARYRGDVVVVEPGSFALSSDTPIGLRAEADYTGMRLVAALPWPAPADAIALVPGPLHESPSEPCPRDWIAALARQGLVALLPAAASPGPEGAEPVGRPAELRVTLRVQEAEIALLSAEGTLLRHGKADLGYVTRPRAARANV